MVSTRTWVWECESFISSVASTPSIWGMRRSIRTTSGRSRKARSAASAPVLASPSTSKSGSLSKMPLRPLRTTGWSSAISRRILSFIFMLSTSFFQLRFLNFFLRPHSFYALAPRVTCSASSGSSTANTVPSPDELSTATIPPRASILSRMPVSPIPLYSES